MKYCNIEGESHSRNSVMYFLLQADQDQVRELKSSVDDIRWY